MDVLFAASAGIPLGSFDPPAVDDAAAADPPKSCLLDNKPFFGESTNATTAIYHNEDPDDDEMSIQVSLFVARPPRVSYVLAWSTGTYFAQVPFIHCTHRGLIRIRLADVVCRTDLSAWVATTWITTTAATSPWHQVDQWRMDCLLQDPQLSVGEDVNTNGLLPPPGEEDPNPPDLGCLFVDRPILSLDPDSIVCFLAKRHYRDREVFEIAVNMVAKKLEVVLPLQTGRITRLFYSTISSHLNMTAAAADTSGARETRNG